MKRISQHKCHPNGNDFACAFNGEDKGVRSKLVRKLYRELVKETIKDKSQLREFIADIDEGCPHLFNSTERNEVTLTPYAFKNGELNLRLGCSNFRCERNYKYTPFRLLTCLDEPIKTPDKLENAAYRERRRIERER